jgi:hypothetical protein
MNQALYAHMNNKRKKNEKKKKVSLHAVVRVDLLSLIYLEAQSRLVSK